MCAHRTISPVSVVAISFSPRWSDAGDFSRTSVDARIQAGYDDAIVQGKIARAPGLRCAVTNEAVKGSISGRPPEHARTSPASPTMTVTKGSLTLIWWRLVPRYIKLT
jgi:hypothetical protein